MKILHFIIRKVIFFTVSGFLLSCQSVERDVVRIGVLKGPSEISFMKMMNEVQEINGRKVEYVIKNEPQQIQSLMMRGEIDFAILPTVIAVNLYNKGLDYKMIACPVWGTLYLLTNDLKIQNIYQLENKEIAVFGQGVTPDILFRNLLKKINIKNVKFNYTYSSNTDVAQALLQRKVKTAVLSEPAVSILLAKDSTIKIVSDINCKDFVDNAERDIFIQTAFLVSRKFSERYPDATERIADEFRLSCNFINNHPEESAQLAVKLHILPDLHTAHLSLPLCNVRYVAAFAIEHELYHYLDIFHRYDKRSIGGKHPDADFIYKMN